MLLYILWNLTSEYRGWGNLSFSQCSLSVVTAVLGGDTVFVGDITFDWVDIAVLGGDAVVFVGVPVMLGDTIEVLDLVAVMVSVCIMEHCRLY